MDRYQALPDLPFPVVIEALGYPLSDFKPRKSGTEWAGKCPLHKPKKNSTAFSYNVDGRFASPVRPKVAGALTWSCRLAPADFRKVYNILEPYAGAVISRQAQVQARKPEIKQVQEQPTENPPSKAATRSS
jgi:hypothetical protein